MHMPYFSLSLTLPLFRSNLWGEKCSECRALAASNIKVREVKLFNIGGGRASSAFPRLIVSILSYLLPTDMRTTHGRRDQCCSLGVFSQIMLTAY